VSNILSVDVGGGAVHAIVDPRSFSAGGIEYQLRYGNPSLSARLVAASLISSFDYLLSDNISAKEAMRRLRILRAERKAATTTGATP
jgi:hypothetical protein